MAWKTSEIATAARLEEFLEGRIGPHLKDRRKRGSFGIYALGILGDGERKSVEPIAARATSDPAEVNNMHSKLLYFLGRSDWDDRAVRLEAARYAIEAIERREPITTWIIDDTGFLKQGSHSVGVQRQYTGSAGKITNCQIGVSLAIATSSEQVSLDFELYLPEKWTEDPKRRKEAHVPKDIAFKSKIELAIDMLERASAAGVPGNVVLADSAYGNSVEFRSIIRGLDLDFAVGVSSQTKVYQLNVDDRARGCATTVRDLALRLGARAFRKVTWRDGPSGKMSSRFCFVRVKTMHDDGITLADREPLWLVAEWPEGEDAPTKFSLTTLPRRMSHKEIVRTIKERWRTEQMYHELKDELGLDHFEGRTYPGWHHHVSVVLCCYAFICAERARAFPPSLDRTGDSHPVRTAA